MAYSVLGLANATTPCANHCCYCLVGRKQYQDVPFEKIKNLALKLHASQQRKDQASRLKIAVGLHYTYNCDVTKTKSLLKINRLLQHDNASYVENFILMNGIYFRPIDELERWLSERKEIGISSIAASLSGNKDIHDRWVGRRGEYDFLMKAMWLAPEIGLARKEKLFLTKTTLPYLDQLMDVLDAIPGEASREITLFRYAGWAKKLERERILKEDFDKLSGRIRKYLCGTQNGGWKTEAEWISCILKGEVLSAETSFLCLHITESNIDDLLSRSSKEIISDLTARTNTAYAAMPDLSNLADRYGNPDSNRIYMSVNDIRSKWLDMYFCEHEKVKDEELVTWM